MAKAIREAEITKIKEYIFSKTIRGIKITKIKDISWGKRLDETRLPR
ncbi:hypothetical protein [Gracilibacillus sp. JCM 18860]